MRLTESGSVRIDNIRTPWADALDGTQRPSVLFQKCWIFPLQHASADDPTGLAQGALNAASKYTANNTRPWPSGGDSKDSATEEFYILERYGTYAAHLEAADALADRAGAKVAKLYADAGLVGSTFISPSDQTNGTSKSNGYANGSHLAQLHRKAITAQYRGEVAA
ncbi:hypothetical protein LTR37_014994 [Vermiconidia calcicola]|uniref:Uncharacterized protein n=1 Tax=Vermiconidia calcicola TaxID=1690605 RepID=A0ACC3MRY6_9PEZI|nr:hypothetical protein LTR37_014994 [Vermiconidia calcicola]